MIGAAAAAARHELVGLSGVVERNWYLVKRYIWWEIAFFLWTCANTLTIVFIAKGVVAEGGSVNIDRLTTILLIGAVIWSYLGIVFELLIETAPITISGQMSRHTAPTPAPFRIACRMPRRA